VCPDHAEAQGLEDSRDVCHLGRFEVPAVLRECSSHEGMRAASALFRQLSLLCSTVTRGNFCLLISFVSSRFVSHISITFACILPLPWTPRMSGSRSLDGPTPWRYSTPLSPRGTMSRQRCAPPCRSTSASRRYRILHVWCGVVWCGVVWCGVVWCGVVWRGVVCVIRVTERASAVSSSDGTTELI
jgi:hypothetical protein